MEVSQHTETLATFTCLALMAGMMITFALGRRAGIRHHRTDPEGARAVSGAVEAAIFGLLGLLIAFTFSGAADRFEVRRALIGEETNAIGAAWLQLDLLHADDQSVLRSEFREYLDARLQFYSSLPNTTAATPYLERAEQLEPVIWGHAVAALPRTSIAGAAQILLPSLTRMFDVETKRRLALLAHPPLPIYALMMILALVCASLAGHHAHGSARHPWILPLMFAGISSLAIFVILDLEYPRAGFIRLDAADALLYELRAQMS